MPLQAEQFAGFSCRDQFCMLPVAGWFSKSRHRERVWHAGRPFEHVEREGNRIEQREQPNRNVVPTKPQLTPGRALQHKRSTPWCTSMAGSSYPPWLAICCGLPQERLFPRQGSSLQLRQAQRACAHWPLVTAQPTVG